MKTLNLDAGDVDPASPTVSKLLAMILLLGFRDRADLVLVGPGPAGGEAETVLQYRVAGTFYTLNSPPKQVLPEMARLVEGWLPVGCRSEAFRFGLLPVVVGGADAEILVAVRDTPAGPNLAFHLSAADEAAGPVSGEYPSLKADRPLDGM